MKKKLLLLLIAVFISAGLYAQQYSKVAVINIDKVLEAYPRAGEAYSKLEKFKQEKLNELKEMKAEILQLKKDQLSALDSGDNEKAVQLEVEIKNKIKRQQVYSDIMLSEIKLRESQIYSNVEILKQMNAAIISVAKKDGYHIVFKLQDESIFWAAEAINITDLVIIKLR